VDESDQHPLPDPVAEGRRIVESAAQRELPLRLLGGVAIALLCPSSRQPPLARRYADIDLATSGAARNGVVELIESLGYRNHREFNVLHGHRRLYFWDEQNQRQVDVFVDEANLCHRIDFRRRLNATPLTLPLADLAIFKLQVVETNQKDYLDLCSIFADFDLTDDDSGVNLPYIANLTASDWGLWRTLWTVAERAERFALELPELKGRERVAERMRHLREALDTVPKSRGWKIRARLGERKRWYEIPEEVH
jgi:hypothetical protein